MSNVLKNMSYWNWVVLAALFISGTFVTGCMRDFVKVDTPPEIVERDNYPTEIPLSQVYNSIESYTANEQRKILEWNNSAEIAEEKVQYWSSMLGAVISPEGLTALGINPAGGAAASLLYFFGLITRRPGDASPKTVAKEKEDSFNAALKKAGVIKETADA